MIWKIATFIAIGVAAFFLFRRAGGVTQAASRDARGAAVGPAGRQQVEDLVECPQCGAYRPKDSVCDCQRAPTL